MEITSRRSGWLQGMQIVAFFLLGIIAVPIFIGLSTGVTMQSVLVFVGSVLILQPVATAVGVALGIPSISLLLMMLSIGIAFIFIIFGICDLFWDKSVWLRNYLDKVDAIAKRSALFQKYGIITIIPFIWVPGVGLYGCILLAWLFQWRGVKGIGIILAGWMLATLLVLGASLGAMEIIA